jgi:DNA polymerase III alpha subunit (gram-positive type)
MSSYLFFDFETTGIGKFSKQKPIQLAWLVCNEEMCIQKQENYYIKGNNELNTDFHKNLTLEFLEKNGYELELVLTKFLKDIASILNSPEKGFIFAHNISFDRNILINSFSDCGLSNLFDISEFDKKSFCTMKFGKDLCKIPVGKIYKYPKLVELYVFLFDNPPVEVLHEAMGDVIVLFNCVKKLVSLGLLNLKA